MAVLETLIRSAVRISKTSASLSPLLILRRLTSASPPPLPPLPFSPLPSCLCLPRSRLLSPLAAAGPLFLASPAWKLSQSATPLHFHGKVEILKVKEGGPPARPVVPGKESDAPRNDRDEVDDSIWNLPNLISISRMVSGPVIGWMIINEWYVTSFVSLALSGITDWLDGFVARRMKINSVLGSYLDPLADKVLICCVALSMVKKDLLHPGLVVLVVVRDVGLIGGAIFKRASILGWQWKGWSDFVSLNTTRPEKVEPLFISKVNTVFQLLLVAAALLQPEFGSDDTQWCITYWSWLVASTTVASSIAYGAHHLRRLPASVNSQ